MSAIESLRGRMAELADLAAIEMLANWDQLVMMPAEGAGARAQQLGTIALLTHERATSAEIGEWLQEIDAALDIPGGHAAGAVLDELDRDVVRLARRDWERARRVPDALAAELAQASAAGHESWRAARESDDFSAFAPALARNVELARAYAECVAEDGQGLYEALLGDFDFGLRTEELRRVFGALGERLPALMADARVHSPRQIGRAHV